jgi:hypothetical protein
MFGNTEEIAQAIADGLGESFDVQLAEVSDAPHEPDPDVALIVASGPTHASSMSRTNTRADAIDRGAKEGERDFGLREWMAALRPGQHAAKIATFDTKIESMRLRLDQRQEAPLRLPPSWVRVRAQAESFYVREVDGPLVEGEVDRARAWARQLATSMTRTPG